MSVRVVSGLQPQPLKIMMFLALLVEKDPVGAGGPTMVTAVILPLNLVTVLIGIEIVVNVLVIVIEDGTIEIMTKEAAEVEI